MPKILIFSSQTGGGHRSLAEALKDSISDDYEVRIVEPQSWLIHVHYRVLSRYFLKLWGAEYRITNGRSRAKLLHLFGLLQTSRIISEIAKFQPDAIISTYVFFSYEVRFALEYMKYACPLIFQLSDPGETHTTWFTEQKVSAVFAPTQEVFDEAYGRYQSPQQVFLTGWPVRRSFTEIDQKLLKKIRTTLSLRQDALTVFIQGGGEGAAQFSRVIGNLVRQKNIQVVCSTGTNSLISTYIKQKFPSVSVIPFTPNIAPYMQVADVVIGKAGPNFLFESITLGKPFIATSYIPGQESANIKFIENHNLGWVALTNDAQRKLFQSLAENKHDLSLISLAVESFARKNKILTNQIPLIIARLLAQ